MKAKQKTSAEIKIELLKRAKKILKGIDKEKPHLGICCCVENVVFGLYSSSLSLYARNCNEILVYISRELGDCAYLYEWLYDHEHINVFMSREKRYTTIRKARLQWIDWMIDSLREHGDENMRKAAKGKVK